MNNQIKQLTQRYPQLESCAEDIQKAYERMVECYENDGKILIAGNGGSAADAEHMVGELMKRFKKPRPISEDIKTELKKIDPSAGEILADGIEGTLTAISLTTHESLSTAYLNDRFGEGVFAQQLYGFGREGDVFYALSTSGNSRNVLLAAIMAKALGITVVGLTGATGGKLAEIADVCIKVPETETYKIQELHLPIHHCLCLMLEENFF